MLSEHLKYNGYIMIQKKTVKDLVVFIKDNDPFALALQKTGGVGLVVKGLMDLGGG
jgi:hypothetical protein